MEDAKYTAIQVAKYLIDKSNNESDSEPRKKLTNIKLQKILYYAQGWYLANFGKPLFKDSIEAWKLGPAIKEVYAAYKSYGSKTIDEKIASDDLEKIASDDKVFLDKLWDVYKDFSANDLITATHNEKPWKEARFEIQEGESSSIEIPISTIRDYFTSLKDS